MCVIIIKQKGKVVPSSVLKSSARINPHGLGIVWLDTLKVSYHESKEYNVLETDFDPWCDVAYMYLLETLY